MRGILLLIACTSTPLDSPPDLAAPSMVFDLASIFDQAPDLFSCGQRSDTGVESKSVINAITAPQTRMDFALDLNGDGKLDNQFGNLMGALRANNLDGQPGLTAAIQAGDYLQLIHLTAAAFDQDPCVTAKMLLAEAMPSPNFTGNGTFPQDTSFAPSAFPGGISSGQYTSDGSRVVAVSIQLPFAGVMVPAILVGARLQFTLSPSTGIPISGQINGAIRGSDLASTFLPNTATLLNDVLLSDPISAHSKALLQVFDIGCTGGAGVAHDGHIDVCEISENSIVKNVLLPDVQLFDATGAYHPVPANTKPDSLSVGLAFTAVGASF